MSLEDVAEALRERVAQAIVDELNGEVSAAMSDEEVSRAVRAISRRAVALALDPVAQTDLCRRIGYWPACFRRVSTPPAGRRQGGVRRGERSLGPSGPAGAPGGPRDRLAA